MDNAITQEELTELVAITSQRLGIKFPFIIEKDYYVTQVIHALSGFENEYFSLVFAGGTCLSKAHKLVKRMSEDVDFKIHTKQSASLLSKTQQLKELKYFRERMKSLLEIEGLAQGDVIARNEGKYSRIDIAYPSVFPAATGLRPHILLEFTLSDIQLETINLTIKSLIEDTIDTTTLFTAGLTECISINETAMEKWVGLTRRISAIEREYYHDDPTLIRHLYDLSSIQQANKIGDDFFNLGKAIISKDSKQFKNQHPEYFTDPISEIQRSLKLLRTKLQWKERYQNFIDAMVYDNSSVRDYESAMKILEGISGDLISTLD